MKILNRIYLNDYVLSYQKIVNMLNLLCIKKDCITKECIGKTAFGYDILCYKIGKGDKHILLIGATHGLENITAFFVYFRMF